MTPQPIRQGDVPIFPAMIIGLTLPADAKRVRPKGGRYVLREGEVTGHAHAIMDRPDVEVYEATMGGAAVIFAKIMDAPDIVRELGPVTIQHEEHKPLPLTPGLHVVGIQVEHTPAAIKPVLD